MESESFSSKKCCECNLFELTFDIHTYSKNDVEWLLLIRNPRNNENCFHQPRLSSEFERSYGCSWTNIIKWYKSSFILHFVIVMKKKACAHNFARKRGKESFLISTLVTKWFLPIFIAFIWSSYIKNKKKKRVWYSTRYGWRVASNMEVITMRSWNSSS